MTTTFTGIGAAAVGLAADGAEAHPAVKPTAATRAVIPGTGFQRKPGEVGTGEKGWERVGDMKAAGFGRQVGGREEGTKKGGNHRDGCRP
jgi:hypothetical protein